MTIDPISGEPIDPIELQNQLAALAADVPGCKHCDAETELVPTRAGTFALAIHHDDDCSWLAEQVSGPDDTYQNRKYYSIEQLAEVKRNMNGDNDNE